MLVAAVNVCFETVRNVDCGLGSGAFGPSGLCRFWASIGVSANNPFHQPMTNLRNSVDTQIEDKTSRIQLIGNKFEQNILLCIKNFSNRSITAETDASAALEDTPTSSNEPMLTGNYSQQSYTRCNTPHPSIS